MFIPIQNSNSCNHVNSDKIESICICTIEEKDRRILKTFYSEQYNYVIKLFTPRVDEYYVYDKYETRDDAKNALLKLVSEISNYDKLGYVPERETKN